MRGNLVVIAFGVLVGLVAQHVLHRGARRLAPPAVGGLFAGLQLASGLVVGSIAGAAEPSTWALAVALGLSMGGLVLRLLIDGARVNAAVRREREGR